MSLQPPAPLGFVGTGLMGKPMAMNLIKAGYRLTAWNRTPSKTLELISAGARLGKSPADVVRDAQAVVLMLENGAIVTELLFAQGVASACIENTLVIDMSSIAPAIAEDHALLLRRAGLRYIVAPVSGGTIAAQERTLAIMAGGDSNDLGDAAPIFKAFRQRDAPGSTRPGTALQAGQPVHCCRNHRGFAIFQLLIAFPVWWVLSGGETISTIVVISVALAVGTWGCSELRGFYCQSCSVPITAILVTLGTIITTFFTPEPRGRDLDDLRDAIDAK